MLAEYYQYFKELVACKTISGSSVPEETDKLIRWISQKCTSMGMHVDVSEHTEPIVTATYMHDESLPTVLLYSWYDVLAADPDEWWKYDPFFLYIARDTIIARGASDAKWQFLISLMAIWDLIEKKDLAYNIIFVIEWSKHMYSPHLSVVLDEIVSRYTIDLSVVVGWSRHAEMPTLYTWCRGGFDSKIHLQTSNTVFDASYFSGVVPNPYYMGMRLLSKLYDTSHRVTVPYFYYEVEDIHVNDLVVHKNIPFDQEEFFATVWVKECVYDKKYDMFSTLSMRPTVQISDIQSPMTPSGIGKSIDITLTWKLVPQQQTKNMVYAFEQWLSNTIGASMDYTLSISPTIEPVKQDLHGKISQKIKHTFANVYDQDPLLSYSPDSYQCMSHLIKEHGIPTIVVPLAQMDSNIAAVNENITIDAIEKWFSFYKQFLRQ